MKIPHLPGWPRRRWHFLLPEGWRRLRDASLLEVAAFQWAAANEQALNDLETIPNVIRQQSLVRPQPQGAIMHIMAQSNHECIGRALEILNTGLKPFVERGTTDTSSTPHLSQP